MTEKERRIQIEFLNNNQQLTAVSGVHVYVQLAAVSVFSFYGIFYTGVREHSAPLLSEVRRLQRLLLSMYVHMASSCCIYNYSCLYILLYGIVLLYLWTACNTLYACPLVLTRIYYTIILL